MWQYVARRVADLRDTYWLVCKRYHCKACKAAGRQNTFNTWDPAVVEGYGGGLEESLDVVFTYKCAVSQCLADYIEDHAVTAASFEAMHRHITNNHHRSCDRSRLQYAHAVDDWNSQKQGQGRAQERRWW